MASQQPPPIHVAGIGMHVVEPAASQQTKGTLDLSKVDESIVLTRSSFHLNSFDLVKANRRTDRLRVKQIIAHTEYTW